MGPLQYLIIGFDGNHFTGEILPELNSLQRQGTIRVVDLLFLQKDDAGDSTLREVSDLSESEAQAFGPLAGGLSGLLTDEDIATASASMPNNSSAAVLLLEHVWASTLKEKILRANGVLLDDGIVPAAEVEALGADLAADEAASQIH